MHQWHRACLSALKQSANEAQALSLALEKQKQGFRMLATVTDAVTDMQ